MRLFFRAVSCAGELREAVKVGRPLKAFVAAPSCAGREIAREGEGEGEGGGGETMDADTYPNTVQVRYCNKCAHIYICTLHTDQMPTPL